MVVQPRPPIYLNRRRRATNWRPFKLIELLMSAYLSAFGAKRTCMTIETVEPTPIMYSGAIPVVQRIVSSSHNSSSWHRYGIAG